jgi:hypothetical protein
MLVGFRSAQKLHVAPIFLLLVASPLVGLSVTLVIARHQASVILDQRRRLAEALLRPMLPCAFPPGCKVVAGDYYGNSDSSLTVVCGHAPSGVLAYFRQNLPKTWRQCRVWDNEHAFVSHSTDELQMSISVDLSDERKTRFTISRNARGRLSTEGWGKVRDLEGNPVHYP